MHILVSNDDGYLSPGLTFLVEALSKYSDVTVVVPDRDRSGMSNALTLDAPLWLTELSADRYKVNGTPVDCVHLGITGVAETEPDQVISGINLGANLGDDVLYSGTAAAAMEGRFLKKTPIAISIDSFVPDHLASAAKVAEYLVSGKLPIELPAFKILNVNVPDLPWNQIKGFKVTRLGRRGKPLPAVKVTQPRGRQGFWIGTAGIPSDAEVGTDFHAVNNGYVSLTPLNLDMSDDEEFAGLNKKMEGLVLDE